MTKVNRIVDKILENWPVKIICLIIAIFLYLFHQSSIIDKRSFVIPVRISQNGSFMLVGNYTQEVTVTVRANSDDINLVRASQIAASINLDSIEKPGTYDIPVSLKVSNELLAFDPFEVTVRPETVRLTVEKKDLQFVRVEPSLVGEPAHGYVIDSVSVSPSFILISGPESNVATVTELKTSGVDVSGITANKEYETSVLSPNKMISFDDRQTFVVTVRVTAQQMERVFENQEINIRNLNPALVHEGALPPVSVKLSGSVPNLEKYSLSSTAVFVDCSQIQEGGVYELPVRISVPSYFKVDEASVQSVVLEIQEADAEDDGEFQLELSEDEVLAE